MFGISFTEMLVILIAGIFFIGPKRLPETARVIGHLYGKVNRQISKVREEVRREIAVEDMRNVMKQTTEEALKIEIQIKSEIEQTGIKQIVKPSGVVQSTLIEKQDDA